jgi:SHS2 domain-containing protein
MYETFPHTADLGLRVEADSLDSLMSEAARGLFSVLVANLDTVRLVEQVEYRVEGDDREYLLFDWLNELLFGFHRNRMILVRFDVRVDEAGLGARCWGEPLDTARHTLDHDIKAITYHGLQVIDDGGLWRAEVVVDI